MLNAELFPFLFGALLSMFPFVAYTQAQAPYVDPVFDIWNTGQALNTCSSGLSKEVQISSQCRQLCFEDEICVAFYTYPFSYRWKCFLFFYGTPHRWRNSTRPNEISGVKKFPGSTLEADGFYYLWLSKASWNFTYAREDCKLSPWFRLALLKTKQSLDIAMAKYKLAATPGAYTAVDLQQNIGNKKATFGDGTPYEDSPVAKEGITLLYSNFLELNRAVFVIWNNFDDEDPGTPKTALCQGDPLMMMT